MSLVPEPCSEERLGQLLCDAKVIAGPSAGCVSAGELAWLVTEARVAARLGAELEAERQEHQSTLRLAADARGEHEAFKQTVAELGAALFEDLGLARDSIRAAERRLERGRA